MLRQLGPSALQPTAPATERLVPRHLVSQLLELVELEARPLALPRLLQLSLLLLALLLLSRLMLLSHLLLPRMLLLLPWRLLLPRLLHTDTLVVIVARTPRQEPATITPQTLDFGVLLLLEGKDVSEPTPHSVASALLKEVACLCDKLKAIKVLTFMLCGFVLSYILLRLKGTLTLVACIIEASCFISIVCPLRMTNRGVCRMLRINMLFKRVFR